MNSEVLEVKLSFISQAYEYKYGLEVLSSAYQTNPRGNPYL